MFLSGGQNMWSGNITNHILPERAFIHFSNKGKATHLHRLAANYDNDLLYKYHELDGSDHIERADFVMAHGSRLGEYFNILGTLDSMINTVYWCDDHRFVLRKYVAHNIIPNTSMKNLRRMAARWDRVRDQFRSLLLGGNVLTDAHRWISPAGRVIDGFTITPLVSRAMLKDEGARMDHCVSGYLLECVRDYRNAHVYSITRPDRADVTFEVVEEEDHTFTIDQVFHAHNNTVTDSDTLAAINTFVRHINSDDGYDADMASHARLALIDVISADKRVTVDDHFDAYVFLADHFPWLADLVSDYTHLYGLGR